MADTKHEFQIRDCSFPDRGLTLCYKEWLHPSHHENDPVVIALHGWMDNAGTFEMLVPSLNMTRVIALDFSGHGLSDHRSADADYYIWDYIQEVLALQKHLGLNTCHLLAHSMGAAVASIFSATFPERVLSLISLDMVGPIPVSEIDLADQMRESILARQDITGQAIRHYSSYEAACESRAQRGITHESAALLGKRGIDKDEEGWFWRVDRQLTRKLPVSLTEAQSQAMMKRIECPCLAITAESTWSHRPGFLEDRLACISHLTHLPLKSSHFLHLEGDLGPVVQSINNFYETMKAKAER